MRARKKGGNHILGKCWLRPQAKPLGRPWHSRQARREGIVEGSEQGVESLVVVLIDGARSTL